MHSISFILATSTEIQANSAGGVIAGGVTAGVLVIIIILVSVLIFVYLRRKGKRLYRDFSASILKPHILTVSLFSR